MAFHFKIQLQEVTNPLVWRKIAVPESISMLKFHEVLQAAFGWSNCHLFEFSLAVPGAYPIGIPNETDPNVQDASGVSLKSIINEKGQKCTYVYDFGDHWAHSIVLEHITTEKIKKADCLAGKGACPPEDCGGVSGYRNLKKILADPENPEYQEMREWMGLDADDIWSADEFNLEETNEMVQDVL